MIELLVFSVNIKDSMHVLKIECLPLQSSGDPVSIFAFDVKSASDIQLQTAKTSLKRIKTLRHPNILTFLDGVEVMAQRFVSHHHFISFLNLG